MNFNTIVPLNPPIQPVTSSRSLRSVNSFRLQVQRTRTEFGRQAFSVAAPTAWNAWQFIIYF